MSTNSASSATRRADPNEVERVPLLPPLDGITPHDEFWLPDGNLILVARNVAFRVYRCLLSFQSMVFADMFAMAMMDADETFEGCPIVHLSDSPEDLTYLFRVLLPKSHRGFYLRGTEVKHSFNEVSALVRLSHKYDIQDVKTQALDWMCQRYTSKFERWQLQRHPQLTANSGLPTTVPPVHSIGVVNVARLTNTLSLLPTVLYSCCELGPSLLDGWTREDGTVEVLSPDDLKRCFAAREKLCKEKAKMMSRVFDGEPGDWCSNPYQCRPTFKDLALALVREELPRQIGLDVLRGFKDDLPRLMQGFPLCSGCHRSLLSRDAQVRRTVWNRLPEIFEISVPGWGEGTAHSDFPA